MATVRRTEGDARKKLDAAIKFLAENEAAAGWFDSSVYPDGTPVAYVAVIQEFGSPQQNIPSRSFQRLTIAEQKQNWAVLFAQGSRQVLNGKLTGKQFLDSFGLQVAGDMRKTISNITEPALADSTIAARASKRGVDVDAVNKDPLRDTGYMVSTLNNQTRKRGSK